MNFEEIENLLNEIISVTEKLDLKLSKRNKEKEEENGMNLEDNLEQYGVKALNTINTTRKSTGKTTGKTGGKESSITSGISLLDVRNLTLCSYLKKLIFFIILKVKGKSISTRTTTASTAPTSTTTTSSDSDSLQDLIWYLVKDRFVLEKTNVLKEKLKYQIDKLLKSASANNAQNIDNPTVDIDEMDPLAFKPNPNAMMENQENDDDNDNNGGEQKSIDGIYRPPRVAPVHYDAEKSSATTKHKLSEKQKEIASRSRLLRDLQSQYDERYKIHLNLQV